MEFCLRAIYEIFTTLCPKVFTFYKSRSVKLKYFVIYIFIIPVPIVSA